MDYEIVEYLKTPFTVDQLKTILKGLNKKPVDLLRPKDKRFKELELSKKDDRSDEDWLKLMVDNPTMIERPVVEYKGKFAMGRPPESIMEILK